MPPRPGTQPLGGAGPPGHDRPPINEARQIVGQLLRRRVTVSRDLAKGLQDDRFQLRRDRTVKRTRRARIVVGDLTDECVAVSFIKRRPEGQELVDRRPERINIATVIDDPAPGQKLLRTGVADRAEKLTADGEPGIAGDLGQSEVGDPELPPQVHEQVARFDVPVHDAQLMGVLERERRLPAKVGHPVEISAVR